MSCLQCPYKGRVVKWSKRKLPSSPYARCSLKKRICNRTAPFPYSRRDHVPYSSPTYLVILLRFRGESQPRQKFPSKIITSSSYDLCTKLFHHSAQNLNKTAAAASTHDHCQITYRHNAAYVDWWGRVREGSGRGQRHIYD
jgi:hypothetical protein